MEQELYEEDVKVVILPDRQEVTAEDLGTMPDVVRERVRFCVQSGHRNAINLFRFWFVTIVVGYSTELTLAHFQEK